MMLKTYRLEGNRCYASSVSIERLVLSGGGAKGVIYPGAIRALADLGILRGVCEVSGASAGSIVASMLASGMTVTKMRDILFNLNFLELTGARIGSVYGNPDGVLFPTKDGKPLL